MLIVGVQLLEGDYTFGLETIDNPWHAELVRTHLTKKLDGMFPDVRDEVASAFDEYIGSAEAGTSTLRLFMDYGFNWRRRLG